MMDRPVVFEREAGFRRVRHDAYKQRCAKGKDIRIAHCWQTPCSTVLPCYKSIEKERDPDDGGILDYELQYTPILFR
jgi:hypothetical protein